MASSGNPQPSTTPVPKKGFMGMRLSWKHLAIIAAAFVGAGVVGLAVNADAIFASSGQRFNDAVYSATQQTRDARSNLEAISADMTVIHDTSSVVESAAPTQRQPLQTAGGSISNPAAPATQNARRAGSAANGNVPVRSYSDSAEPWTQQRRHLTTLRSQAALTTQTETRQRLKPSRRPSRSGLPN